jgi:hypothetical protein
MVKIGQKYRVFYVNTRTDGQTEATNLVDAVRTRLKTTRNYSQQFIQAFDVTYEARQCHAYDSVQKTITILTVSCCQI